MDDQQALLANVIEHPEEDLPRLVYAEYLEDTAKTRYVKCPRCNGTKEAEAWMLVGPLSNHTKVPIGMQPCHMCEDDNGNPTGEIATTDGKAERAEFIRTQIRMNDLIGTLSDPKVSRLYNKLQEREKQLFQKYQADWFLSPTSRPVRLPYNLVSIPAPSLVVSRGFPSSAITRFDDWYSRSEGVQLVEHHPICWVYFTDVSIYQSSGNDTFYVAGVTRFPQKYWSRFENLPSRSAAFLEVSDVSLEWARFLARPLARIQT